MMGSAATIRETAAQTRHVHRSFSRELRFLLFAKWDPWSHPKPWLGRHIRVFASSQLPVGTKLGTAKKLPHAKGAYEWVVASAGFRAPDGA